VFKEYNPAIHIERLEYDERYPVEIAVDPGYSGAYAVLALQQIEQSVHILDEVYMRQATGEEVINACKKRWWWWKLPRAKDGKTAGAIDVAAHQHPAADSQIQTWGNAGITFHSKQVKITDGILAVRRFLKHPSDGTPRIFFNTNLSGEFDFSNHPMGILAEFRRYKYPDWREGQRASDLPIDAYNHSCKALAYWLVYRFGLIGVRPTYKDRQVIRSYWA